MTRIARIISMTFILFAFLPPSAGRADMAPPLGPTVAGLEPGYQRTRVQMLYEVVVLDLVYIPPHPEGFNPFPASSSHAKAAAYFSGNAMHNWSSEIRVTASFNFINRGTEEETMQAIFPLTTEGYGTYTYEILPETFAVSVNGISVPSNTNLRAPLPGHPEMGDILWAEFEVRFPVGEEVFVRIEYTMAGGMVGWSPITSVEYMLETGSGWYGPIGQADLTFRLPYPATEENIRPGTSEDFVISGNELTWSKQNFEPTWRDNRWVTFVSPKAWLEIEAGRHQVNENPTGEAWIQLARIYCRVAYNGKEINDYYYHNLCSEAYQQAIGLEPNNAEYYAEFADQLSSLHYYELLRMFPLSVNHPLVRQITRLIERALALDPHNQDALQLYIWMKPMVPDWAFTVDLPPTATPWPTSTPTSTPTQTLTPSSTKTPTPEPSPSPTVTAVPTHAARGGPLILLILLAVLLGSAGVGLLAWQNRRRKQSPPPTDHESSEG